MAERVERAGDRPSGCHRRPSRENTVAAFRRAARDGQPTPSSSTCAAPRDGVLVVHHNPHLPDGRADRRAPTHADLPGVGAHAWRRRSMPAPGMWVNVEIKNDPTEPDFDPTDSIADETMAQLHRPRRARSLAHLVVPHRDHRSLPRHRRRSAPPIRTAWLHVDACPTGVAEMLASQGHVALHPWVRVLTRDVIDACHAPACR